MAKKVVTKRKTEVSIHPETIRESVKTMEVPASEQTPDMMLAVAVSKGMDLTYIEKLMELQQRWIERKAEREYSEAFAGFQSCIPDLRKTGKAAFQVTGKDGNKRDVKYNHDDIGSLKAVIREPLARFGLSQTWKEWEADGKLYVSCVIRHVGGYKEIGEPLSESPDTSGSKNNIQAKGSTLTYLRRYTLTGMLGLSSSDDDGHGAGGAVTGQDGVVDLPRLNDGQFNNFVKKVIAEKNWTMERIDATCSLTSDQRVAIQDILNSMK